NRNRSPGAAESRARNVVHPTTRPGWPAQDILCGAELPTFLLPLDRAPRALSCLILCITRYRVVKDLSTRTIGGFREGREFVQNVFAESSRIVTGPSLTSSTCMFSWKRPVSVRRPAARTFSPKYS